MYWLQMIIIALTVSLLLTGVIIPQIIRIAFRRKLFDKPDGRKIHKGYIPRLGGTAFFPSIVFAISLTLGIFMNVEDLDADIRILENFESILFVLCSVTLLYLVGLADDLSGVRYRSKFAVQIVCAALTIFSGVCISNLSGVLWIHSLPTVFSWLLTAFMVVYIVNAINLIDGIDGLAAGLSAIAVAFYGWIFYLDGEYIDSMIAWTTFGTLLSFLYYNVFGNPLKRRKVFMGDTGSLTVGMIIAFLSIELTRDSVPSALEGANPMMIAYSPMLIPLFDVVRVSLHRVKCRRNPFLPDRSHIHHKLLAMGFSARKSLAIILFSSITLVVFNVKCSRFVNVNILLGVDILLWTVANMFITTRIRRREKHLGRKLYV